MKKHFLTFLLVLAMLLAGCGQAETGKVAANTEPEKAPETTAIPQEAERPVTMGRLEEGTYINEYTGYACDLDSSWTFMTAEELQELPENIHEMIKDSELGEQMDTANQFTDMLAENAEQMVTINVLYQKQSLQDRVTYAMYSEEEILDEVLKLQDQMVEAYAQGGFEVEKIEKVAVNFLGEQRWALRTTSTTQGVPYITLQIFDYHLGGYSVTLTLASFVEDNTEALLDLFYRVA